VLTHQLQVERRTGKVRQSETDVLPLCHATNFYVTTINYQCLDAASVRYGRFVRGPIHLCLTACTLHTACTQEYFAHHSISGDVLPDMVYLDHGQNWTLRMLVQVKGGPALFADLLS